MPKTKQPLDPAIEESIVQFVQSKGGDVASSDIGEAVDLDKNTLRRYLPSLVEQGRLSMKGKKRWTRYFIGSGEPDKAKAMPKTRRVPVSELSPEKSLRAQDYVDVVDVDQPDAEHGEIEDAVDLEIVADEETDQVTSVDERTSDAELSPELILADPKDPLEVVMTALPMLEGEHTIDKFGKAILALLPGAEVHELQIRRQLSKLVKEGHVNARQVYDQGWRFYYSKAHT